DWIFVMATPPARDTTDTRALWSAPQIRVGSGHAVVDWRRLYFKPRTDEALLLSPSAANRTGWMETPLIGKVGNSWQRRRLSRRPSIRRRPMIYRRALTFQLLSRRLVSRLPKWTLLKCGLTLEPGQSPPTVPAWCDLQKRSEPFDEAMLKVA